MFKYLKKHPWLTFSLALLGLGAASTVIFFTPGIIAAGIFGVSAAIGVVVAANVAVPLAFGLFALAAFAAPFIAIGISKLMFEAGSWVYNKVHSKSSLNDFDLIANSKASDDSDDDDDSDFDKSSAVSVNLVTEATTHAQTAEPSKATRINSNCTPTQSPLVMNSLLNTKPNAANEQAENTPSVGNTHV